MSLSQQCLQKMSIKISSIQTILILGINRNARSLDFEISFCIRHRIDIFCLQFSRSFVSVLIRIIECKLRCATSVSKYCHCQIIKHQYFSTFKERPLCCCIYFVLKRFSVRHPDHLFHVDWELWDSRNYDWHRQCFLEIYLLHWLTSWESNSRTSFDSSNFLSQWHIKLRVKASVEIA